MENEVESIVLNYHESAKNSGSSNKSNNNENQKQGKTTSINNRNVKDKSDNLINHKEKDESTQDKSSFPTEEYRKYEVHQYDSINDRVDEKETEATKLRFDKIITAVTKR